MTDLDLVRLARQGNPQAIATLLNRQLHAKGIVVKAVREQDCLDLLLESPKALNREVAIAGMQKRLLQLNPAGVKTVRLQAIQGEAFSPVWSHEFQLADISFPPQKIEKKSFSPNSKLDVRETFDSEKTPLKAQISVSDLLLLGFSFLLFIVFCRLLHFNFFAGIFLAFISATLAFNRGQSFWAWYAYGLNLYIPATFQTSFLKGFNPYGILFLFLGIAFSHNFTDEIGVLLLIPNLIFGLIPAIIAFSRTGNFINWYMYGVGLFFVSLFHAFLLESGILKTVKYRNLEDISCAGKDLTGANFQGSNLQGADFRRAKLLGANFKDTNLQQADFSNANLWGAKFDRADLRGANLSRATNLWQHSSQSKLEDFLPWWAMVGFGLLACQLLLWGLFYGSPFGLLLSGRPNFSWDFVTTRAPFVLSSFTLLLVTILTLLTLFLGRKQGSTIVLLAAVALTTLASISRSLWLLGQTTLSLPLIAITFVSLTALGLALWQATRSLQRRQWRAYCTSLGVMSATCFWAVLLANGSDAIAPYLKALVPNWPLGSLTFRAIWFAATLTAWGALAGNALGILVSLCSTDFRSADLTGANLRNAEFSNADFTDANVNQVDWAGATLKNTTAPDGRSFWPGTHPSK